MDAWIHAEAQQYLTFVVAGDEYAVQLGSVREIIHYTPPTFIPRLEPWVVGVVNLRGLVVPIIDLALKFNRPAVPITKYSCILMAEIAVAADAVTIGVIVDSVDQVFDLPASAIKPVPPFGTRVRLDYLNGMAELEDGRFALLLDVDRAFSLDDMAEVAAAVASDEARAALIPGDESR